MQIKMYVTASVNMDIMKIVHKVLSSHMFKMFFLLYFNRFKRLDGYEPLASLELNFSCVNTMAGGGGKTKHVLRAARRCSFQENICNEQVLGVPKCMTNLMGALESQPGPELQFEHIELLQSPSTYFR